MSSDDAESAKRTVMTLWRRDCPTRRQCVPELAGSNQKSSAADHRKSEGCYKEMVGARGMERASTRYVINAVEWSQIPGHDATENFLGQHGDLEFYLLQNPQPM